MQNGNHNSHIEVLLGVVRNLLVDLATLIADHPQRSLIPFNSETDLSRDFKTINARTQGEGIQFLTVTLPSLGKWYDKFLSLEGTHPGFCPIGFKPYTSENLDTFPLLLRTYYFVLTRFDPTTDTTANIIKGFRSLFYCFYKLELPLTPASEAEALRKWYAHELWLSEFEYPEYMDEDVTHMRELITRVACTCWGTFTNVFPRHGPGAVSGGEVGDEKWHTATYIPSLHRVYPRYDLYFGFRSSGRISPEIAGEIIDFVKRSGRQEIAVSRLLFVPKDSRGPRVISCEPKELMFVQQGVARNFMKEIEKRTDNHVNFLDQSINASLARESSLSGKHGTVDLEDASDCVSLKLVELVFPEWSLRYLRALRSESTLLPDGNVVRHHKYAPMGSAMCFPVESVVFWALCVRAHVNAGFTLEDAMSSTYVYGDDLVIDPRAWPDFLRLASKLAIKVNRDKSFVRGPFRESCGLDAYYGKDVTPLRIKKGTDLRSRDGIRATSICKYAGKYFDNDYQNTGEYLASIVERVFGKIPRVTFDLGCLHIKDPLASDDLTSFNVRWCPRRCALVMKGWVVTQPTKTTHLQGLGRLLKNWYSNWREHDPSSVAEPRAAKTRKRDVLVEMFG